MNTMHPILAAALVPMAPPSSVVHRIVADEVFRKPVCDDRCSYPSCMGPQEAARLQADQHYNELKNSGELERRRIATAIRNERPHPWEITL